MTRAFLTLSVFRPRLFLKSSPRVAMALALFGIAPVTRAQAQNLGDVANQIHGQFDGIVHLVSTLGCMIGIVAGGFAILKSIEASKNGQPLPTQNFVMAAVFFGLPLFFSVASSMIGEPQSVDASEAPSQAAVASTPPAADPRTTTPTALAANPQPTSQTQTTFSLPQQPIAALPPRKLRAPAKPWALPDFSDPDAAADASLNAAAPAPLYWPGQQAAAFPRAMYDDSNASNSDADQTARREHAKSRLAWIAGQADAKNVLGRDIR